MYFYFLLVNKIIPSKISLPVCKNIFLKIQNTQTNGKNKAVKRDSLTKGTNLSLGWC